MKNRLIRIKAYLQGWRLAQHNEVIEDLLNRRGIEGAKLYTKGFYYKLIYNTQQIDFCVIPTTGPFHELIPCTDQEYFDHMKKHVDKLER